MSTQRAEPPVLAHPLLPSLERLNWDDLPAVFTACADAFMMLTARNWGLLTTLLEQLPHRPELTAMCESYDFLDKLVLHNAPAAGTGCGCTGSGPATSTGRTTTAGRSGP